MTGRPAVLLALLGLACGTPGPAPIAYGAVECEHCHMTASDPRFGAELVTRRGRILVFDDPGCLAAYLSGGTVAAGDVHSLWVTDFLSPDSLIPVTEAVFLKSDSIRTPMDSRVAALRPGRSADSLRATLGGELISWDAVVAGAGGHEGGGTRAATPGPAAGAMVQPGEVGAVAEAIRRAAPGDRIVLRAGTYHEGPLVIDKPLTLEGEGRPVIRGRGDHTLLRVTADSVVLRGLVLAHVEPSNIEDRAALLLDGVTGCVVEDLEVRDAFFGIYAARTEGCRLAGNRVIGPNRLERHSGNGIHLWTARRMDLTDNLVTGHRDGLYFEFVEDTRIERNTSAGNARYGLHFMFSHNCAYRENLFRENGAGIAVMYTRHITIEGNRFEDNRGPTAYGLLLKEIADSRLAGNSFLRNTVGLLADGGGRLEIRDNRFEENGWAVKLMASSMDNRFEGNRFTGNSFDLATNSRSNYSTFRGNWWDRYRGYDLDRDGTGDVPYRPVRLFSLLVMQHEPAMILLRSTFVDLLDAAERVLPVLTPETLADAAPLMEPPR